MKKVNWMAAGACLVSGMIAMLGGYIAGHTACAHQHVSEKEQRRMFGGKRRRPNTKHYILEAFKDYGRMMKDPLGLERDWLD